MMHLLAQTDAPVVPTERQMVAAEEAATRVAEKLLSGVENAAAAQPVQYLNVLVIVAVLFVIVVIARRTFTYLNEKEAREEIARAERAAEERAQREHTQLLADRFHAAQLTASATCHEHSLQMMVHRNEGTNILKDCVSELHGVTTDLKVAVNNIGAAAQDNRKTAESMLKMRQQPGGQ